MPIIALTSSMSPVVLVSRLSFGVYGMASLYFLASALPCTFKSMGDTALLINGVFTMLVAVGYVLVALCFPQPSILQRPPRPSSSSSSPPRSANVPVLAWNKARHALSRFVGLRLMFLLAMIDAQPRELSVWAVWFALHGLNRFLTTLGTHSLAVWHSQGSAPAGNLRRFYHLSRLLILVNGALLVAAAQWLMPVLPSEVLMLIGIESVLSMVFALKLVLHTQVFLAYGVGLGPAAEYISLEGQENYRFKADLVVGFCIGLVDLTHAVLMLYCFNDSVINVVPLFDVFLLCKSKEAVSGCYTRVQKYRTYRKAIHNIDHNIADAVGDDLGDEEMCTICFDELVVGNCKKLACGHLFHPTCIRHWFQVNTVCPICRHPAHGPAPQHAAAAAAAVVPHEPDERKQQQQQQQPGLGVHMQMQPPVTVLGMVATSQQDVEEEIKQQQQQQAGQEEDAENVILYSENEEAKEANEGLAEERGLSRSS